MTKKVAARVSVPPSKAKKNLMVTKAENRSSKTGKQVPQRPPAVKNPGYQQAVDNYQQGLKLLQEHKFERAKAALQKVIDSGQRELADRAKVHMSACNQQLARGNNVFKTPEEHYDFAVSLMNLGEFVEAREHLEKILKQAPEADYAWYGMGVLECLTGHQEDALKGLAESIKRNPANRYQARNDSDLRNLADDPRFTELIYPEPDGH